jgi:hypothetical protein
MTTTNYNPSKMHRALVASFDETDLQIICFDLAERLRSVLADGALDLEYENVKGENKRATALALVQRSRQYGVMEELARLMIERRKDLDIVDTVAEQDVFAYSQNELASHAKPHPTRMWGDYRYMMGDRIHQVWQFDRFFKPSLSRYPERPQVYFVHGEAGQSHRNFVQRLVMDRIRPFAVSTKGEMLGTVTHLRPNTPEPADDIEVLKADMKIGIFEAVSPYYDPSDMSAEAFCKHEKLKSFAYVVIEHFFEVTKQSGQLEKLIEWYLKEYWAGVRPNASPSKFLILINLVYVHPGKTLWQQILSSREPAIENFKQSLLGLSENLNKLFPCLLFAELRHPDQKELCRTLTELGFNDDDDCPKWLKDLYKRNRGKVKMTEIEKELKRANLTGPESSDSQRRRHK